MRSLGTATRSSQGLLRLEKALTQQRRLSTAKINQSTKTVNVVLIYTQTNKEEEFWFPWLTLSSFKHCPIEIRNKTRYAPSFLHGNIFYPI